MVCERQVWRWSSSRGKQLMCIKAGQHSARSPKHYPTWKMNEDRVRKRADKLALQQEQAEVQSHLDSTRRLLGSTREQS